MLGDDAETPVESGVGPAVASQQEETDVCAEQDRATGREDADIQPNNDSYENAEASSARSKSRGPVWESFCYSRTRQATLGRPTPTTEHFYKCKHCSKVLSRKRKEIMASHLVVHVLSCKKASLSVQKEIAKSSNSKAAITFLDEYNRKSSRREAGKQAQRNEVQGYHRRTPGSLNTAASLNDASAVERVLRRMASSPDEVFAALFTDDGTTDSLPEASSRPVTGPMDKHCDRITPIEREEMDLALALYFVAMATPFSHAESPVFVSFIEKLRPAYARGRHGQCLIPGRKRLATTLLDNVYQVVKKLVQEKERRCPGPMSICFDGSHVVRRHCLNVLTNLSDGTDIFRESICTLENRVTAEYMARLMKKQIEEIGADRVCSVATDNTSSVVKARRLICEEMSTLIDVGDGPHCVDLLIEDAVKTVPELKLALGNCKIIIQFVKSHTYVDAYHQSLALEMKKPYAMEYFPDTRFAYVEKMVSQITRTWSVLQSMLSIDNSVRWESATSTIEKAVVDQFFNLVRDPRTFDNFTATLQYCKPLSALVHVLESNSLRFADVLPLAVNTFGTVQSVRVRTETFSDFSKSELMEICKRRLFGESNTGGLVVLIRSDHYAATVLDPLFRPATISQYDVGYAVNSIRKYYRNMTEKGDCAIAQFDDYCLKQKAFDRAPSQGLIWKQSEDNSLLDFNEALKARKASTRGQSVNWWRLYGNSAPELQQYAIALACASPQAVSADRSFSLQKHIHNKSRSRLSISSVDKATYSYFNLRSVYNFPEMRRKSDAISMLIADIEDAVNDDEDH